MNMFCANIIWTILMPHITSHNSIFSPFIHMERLKIVPINMHFTPISVCQISITDAPETHWNRLPTLSLESINIVAGRSAVYENQKRARLDFQPFCEPAFLAHGWITGLPIVFLDQSQRSLLESSRLPCDYFCHLSIQLGGYQYG